MLLMPLLSLTNIQVLTMCHALCIVDYFVDSLKDFMKKLKMSNPNNLSKIHSSWWQSWHTYFQSQVKTKTYV